MNEVAFRGSTSLPDHIKEFSTPIQIFCYFFSKELIDLVVRETNRCALSQDINSQFSVNIDDIYHYIGIHLYMSIYRYPNLESYWGKNAFEPVRNTMTFKRFKSIKKYLSFRDENERVHHMAGVDLMDGLMGRYHVRAKTRDAMIRLFYHFIDMAATNAYLLYRRIHVKKLKDSRDDSKIVAVS